MSEPLVPEFLTGDAPAPAPAQNGSVLPLAAGARADVPAVREVVVPIEQHVAASYRAIPAALQEKLVPQLPMGMVGISTRKLGIDVTRLKIIHAIRSARDVGRPGQLKIGVECFDYIDAVPIKAHPTRVLREGPEDKKIVTCMSTDNEAPDSSVPAPKSTSCKSCPMAQWTDPVVPGGKRVKPKCESGIAFLLMLPYRDDQPVWFIVTGTAEAAGWELMKQVTAMSQQRDLNPPLQGLHQVCVRITTKEEQGTAGGLIWYTPIFTVTNPTKPWPFEYYAAAVKAVEQTLWYAPEAAAGAAPGSALPAAQSGSAPWDTGGV